MTDGEIYAILGPTNTGKTHRAITRMLQHRSGMIGLPLRLLAREVYDRISAEKGEHAVALVTGEEKRIPIDPKFFVCTVEAMPVDRPVAFLAVDEIQLAGDRNRGHVFTDRLLHARGVRETMFLGSETIAPLLERLVPTARIQRHPRFSKLSHAGWKKLEKLPPRTAIVAFSADRVYQVAEQMRRRHGGTAVVLGALSPRTRNAQVAMYEAGEVPFLVATDAIGMGLNMDVQHVAFTGLGKYDGKGHRALSAAEVGQIAGRAGRYRRDGTFGATGDLREIPPEVVEAVESHAFAPLKRLWWRNTDLDHGSLDALRASLAQPPPAPFLSAARDEEDEAVLAQLAALDEVRQHARTPAQVRLLWDVCQVPDFRKTLTDQHVQLLLRIWQHLAHDRRIPASWIGRQLDNLDRVDGDLDLLMTRIAWVRTWTYITHRGAWLDDAVGWQERARAVDDRLSDALHAALTERFVDRRSMALATGSGAVAGSQVRVGGFVAGSLQGITWKATDPAAEKAARALLSDELEARVQRFVDARDFDVDAEGNVSWEGGLVARFVAGPDVLQPGVKLQRHDLLSPSATARIERRLRAFARDYVTTLLAPLHAEEPRDGASRGLVYELAQGLGTIAPRRADTFGDRATLARLGVRFGTEHCYVLLGRPDIRHVLWTTWRGPGRDAAWHRATGSPLVGGVPVPVAELEVLAARLRALARSGPFGTPDDTDGRVIAGLGYRRMGERWTRGMRRDRAYPIPTV